MKKLKDVDWRSTYPNCLENEQFMLKRKNWGFRLLYDVYLKQEGMQIFLGTCIVKEASNDCNFKCKKQKYATKELVATSRLLKKRMEDINTFINKSFNN